MSAAGCDDLSGAAGSDSVKSRLFAVQYITEVKNIPKNAKELRLWFPVPKNNLHQHITELAIVTPLKHRVITEKKYGNKMVFLSLPNPPSRIKVEMLFRVRRYENSARHGRSVDTRMIKPALQADNLMPLSPEIRRIAERIAEGRESNRDKARAFYEYIVEQMAYDKTGTGWGCGDFWYARNVRKGNCTDYHAYFIGLCRNIGIPAYLEIGLSIPTQPTAGETGGYHCWAYFWDGTQWIPVDISEGDKRPEMKDYFFANHCENRVAFAIGRDVVLEPSQKGEPLKFFIYPYAEVDGKPHADIGKRSYYRSLKEQDSR